MKKTLALILALCMVLTASFALAATTTDVADRANDATLTSAYEAIMAAAHFGDVLGIEDANDLVVTQLFSVAAEGENIEFTISGVATKVAFFDGAAWNVLEAANDGVNTTVVLPKAGVVAVLAQRVVAAATTEPVMYDPSISPAFTPSVSGKAAPAVTGVNGAAPSDLVVTAVSERALTNDVLTREHLEWAFNNILNNEMEVAADTTGLVVRDLFEVTAYGAAVEATANGVEITFETGLTADDTLVVVYSANAATWEVLAAENIVVNNDGTVTLKLPKLGAVAFMVEAPEDLPNADQAVSSPE